MQRMRTADITNQNRYETENFLGALLRDAMDFVSTDSVSSGPVIFLRSLAVPLSLSASLSSAHRRNRDQLQNRLTIYNPRIGKSKSYLYHPLNNWNNTRFAIILYTRYKQNNILADNFYYHLQRAPQACIHWRHLKRQLHIQH